MIRKDISEYQVRDEAYIEAFCENPKDGKSAALEKAGYVGEYIAQEAYRIHSRLQKRIDERLDEMINEGANLGYSVLKGLATGAQSESVQAKCAIALMDYSGRKPGEKLTIQKEQTIEEIDAEIIDLLTAEMEALNLSPEEMAQHLVKGLSK
ncbi:MAG: hypothetical protein GQ572_09265 [Gammaproteobacteria bacterium]|nr:hypothetical protein [Gammaproteobacteria bacterium]